MYPPLSPYCGPFSPRASYGSAQRDQIYHRRPFGIPKGLFFNMPGLMKRFERSLVKHRPLDLGWESLRWNICRKFGCPQERCRFWSAAAALHPPRCFLSPFIQLKSSKNETDANCEVSVIHWFIFDLKNSNDITNFESCYCQPHTHTHTHNTSSTASLNQPWSCLNTFQHPGMSWFKSEAPCAWRQIAIQQHL